MGKTTHRPKNKKLIKHITKELFRTPRNAYLALYKHYPFLIKGRCLDPSAGDGRWIEDIIALGNTNKHRIYDIRKSEYKTWKRKGLVKTLGKSNCIICDNWLDEEKPPYRYDSIITNPPFSLAEQFVTKSLHWVKPGGKISILQRLNWLGTQKRSIWLKSMPLKYVIVISKRITWELDGKEKNNTDNVEYAFFVFQKNFMGKPTVKWLKPL
jgi:hypothetical protein